MMRKAAAVTVHSTLTGIYKIKKKVKFTTVSVKLFEPVVVLGLGMTERPCKPIELVDQENNVHGCKPGKATADIT